MTGNVRRALVLVCMLCTAAFALTTASPQSIPQLTHLKSYLTSQGNASHLAWSDDGGSLYVADEEGYMTATKINVANLSSPSIAATNRPADFLWAVDQHAGLLVFQPSLGTSTVRLNPSTLTTVWTATVGQSHSIATNGTNIWLPVESTPGSLKVLSSAGAVIATAAAPDGWTKVYTAAYDASTQRLYVASGAGVSNAPGGIPGGIYIFDVSKTVPVYLRKIAQPAANIAVRGTRLWVASGASLQTWDVSGTPALLGTWTAATVTVPGSQSVVPSLGPVTANATGTRAYVTYYSVTAGGGTLPVSNQAAGFMIFDTTGSVPRLIKTQGRSEGDFGGQSGTFWAVPSASALSPNGATLAVSYWDYGVSLYNVAGDAATALGSVATAGEAHDVYVDSGGYLYVFNRTNFEVLSATFGTVVQTLPFNGLVDGGWQPFRDNRIVLPGRYPIVAGLSSGAISYWQPLTGGGQALVTAVVFDGTTYLYASTNTGLLQVYKVTVTSANTYTATVVGSLQIPRADNTSGPSPLWALSLAGAQGPLWGLGPTVGVVAIDVSKPTAPRLLYRDPFTFSDNGNHVGLALAQNRVYAGAGALGVRIYNPATYALTGTIGGLNVNFLDVVSGNSLVVANYWYAAQPDGVYVYNIAANPDAPPLIGSYPQPKGGANFRARSIGGLIYRLPLFGVDVLKTP